MKRTMFAAYKQLYQALDLYDEQKLRVYGYLVSAAKDGGSVALRPPALPKRRARPPRRRTRRRRTGMHNVRTLSKRCFGKLEKRTA